MMKDIIEIKEIPNLTIKERKSIKITKKKMANKVQKE